MTEDRDLDESFERTYDARIVRELPGGGAPGSFPGAWSDEQDWRMNRFEDIVQWAVIVAAWASLALAPASMVIGHLGEHALSWKANYVSTFAARAPNDSWITAAMLLAAFGMLCIGAIAAGRRWTGGRIPGALIAMAMGAAAAGLLLLASFEETAAGLRALKKLGFDAIRQQSFHDAGLLVFFYSAILALFASGVAILAERGLRGISLGAAVAASGPLSYAAIATAWPATIGVAGDVAGLKQRAAFLLLWIGALLLLTAIARRQGGATCRATTRA